jgi:Uma2 family endonuclease
MSTATETKRYTPEDLLKMPDGNRYELVDGQLVEKDMSFWSSYVAGNVHAPMKKYADEKKAGWVVPEGTTYQCFSDAPDKVRKPDTSFIRIDRLSTEQAMSKSHMTTVPDLAVEVISPNDTVYEVDRKVQEFLDAGVELIWVINPEQRTVEIHRAKDPTKVDVLREHQELDGENILPGFRLPIRNLFLPPGGA